MSLNEKINLIQAINERKGSSRKRSTAEQAADDAFYSSHYDTVIAQLNANLIIIEAMQRGDGTQADSSMMISYPGDSLVSKMEILKHNQGNAYKRFVMAWLPKWGKTINYRKVIYN